MNVIHMAVDITLVTDNMIPEPALSKLERAVDIVTPLEVEREVELDAVKHLGEVAGLIIDAHQPKKVIWQYDIRQQSERVYSLHSSQRVPEQGDVAG